MFSLISFCFDFQSNIAVAFIIQLRIQESPFVFNCIMSFGLECVRFFPVFSLNPSLYFYFHLIIICTNMVTVFQVAHDILCIKNEDEEDIKEGGKAGKDTDD